MNTCCINGIYYFAIVFFRNCGGGRSYLIIVNRHRYRGLSCRLGEGRGYRGRAPARQPGHNLEVGVDGGGDKEL